LIRAREHQLSPSYRAPLGRQLSCTGVQPAAAKAAGEAAQQAEPLGRRFPARWRTAAPPIPLVDQRFDCLQTTRTPARLKFAMRCPAALFASMAGPISAPVGSLWRKVAAAAGIGEQRSDEVCDPSSSGVKVIESASHSPTRSRAARQRQHPTDRPSTSSQPVPAADREAMAVRIDAPRRWEVYGAHHGDHRPVPAPMFDQLLKRRIEPAAAPKQRQGLREPASPPSALSIRHVERHCDHNASPGLRPLLGGVTGHQVLRLRACETRPPADPGHHERLAPAARLRRPPPCMLLRPRIPIRHSE